MEPIRQPITYQMARSTGKVASLTHTDPQRGPATSSTRVLMDQASQRRWAGTDFDKWLSNDDIQTIISAASSRVEPWRKCSVTASPVQTQQTVGR
jgi:hypothetical protein